VLALPSGLQLVLFMYRSKGGAAPFLAKRLAEALFPAGKTLLTGADQLSRYLDLFRTQRLGLVVNHSARTSRGIFIADLLPSLGADLAVIFTPEHGLRGKVEPGAPVAGESYRGVPVRSLYGRRLRPDPADLKNLDFIVYDIQDVACRFYTYISTMAMTMESAAEAGVPFVVLDRPCLRGGLHVEGPVLDPQLRSFVGYLPLPAAYGMTCGELARMAAGERWLRKAPALVILSLEGWKRSAPSLWTPRFVPPSPNLPDLESVLVYPGMCLLEGTNLNEGRGTKLPFTTFGAPWLDGALLACDLNRSKLCPGVTFLPVRFTPRPLPGMVRHPRYKGEECSGLSIIVTDPAGFEPFQTACCVLSRTAALFKKDFAFNVRRFKRLAGAADLHKRILSEEDPHRILDPYRPALRRFNNLRLKYLLY